MWSPPFFCDGERRWELITANSFLEYRPCSQRRTTRSLPRHFKYDGLLSAAPAVSVASQRREPGRERAKKRAAARAEEQLLREAVARAVAEAEAGVAPSMPPARGCRRGPSSRMLAMLGALTTRQRLRAKVSLHALAEQLAQDQVTSVTLKRNRPVFFFGPDEDATSAFLEELTEKSWRNAFVEVDGRRIGKGHCGDEQFKITAFPRVLNDEDVAKAVASMAGEGKRCKAVFVAAEWDPLPRPAQLLLEKLGRRWRGRVLLLVVVPEGKGRERSLESCDVDGAAAAATASIPRLWWWPGDGARQVIDWLRE